MMTDSTDSEQVMQNLSDMITLLNKTSEELKNQSGKKRSWRTKLLTPIKTAVQCIKRTIQKINLYFTVKFYTLVL